MRRNCAVRIVRESDPEHCEAETESLPMENAADASAYAARSEAEELAELGDEIVRMEAYLQETENRLERLMAEYDRLRG